MEYEKITNFLGSIPDKVPRFATKKWIEVHDQWGNADNRYKPNKQIRFKTPISQSNLCDYSDPYIFVKETITVEGANDRENNAPFISSISKINNSLINNAENLDIAMPMYNLNEYSKNYSKTSRAL